jgi:hypothetical protein
MIGFVQLPYRSLAAHTAEQPLSSKAAAPPKAHSPRRRAMLSYLRLIQFHDPQELGPRVVGITLGLILACQLALVLWLYLSQGRP